MAAGNIHGGRYGTVDAHFDRDFSDNDTATQQLYGEIAADAEKRQTFANNVVSFLKQYGASPEAKFYGRQTTLTASCILICLLTLRQRNRLRWP